VASFSISEGHAFGVDLAICSPVTSIADRVVAPKPPRMTLR
jgi:hypothetical protein